MDKFHWFDLSKYDEVKVFTPADWTFHIGLRLCKMFGDPNEYESSANRLLTAPMSKLNFCLAGGSEKGVTEIDKTKLNNTDADNEILYDPSNFIPHRFIFENFPIIGINTKASNEQIINDFTEWLKNYRNSIDNPVPKKQFKQSDFDKWQQYKILPYLDLKFICKIKSIALTQPKIADLLFKYMDGDRVNFIRKTLDPLALEIITWKTWYALSAQTAGQHAELRGDDLIRMEAAMNRKG